MGRGRFGHPPFVHLDREVRGGSWRLGLATRSLGALACVSGACAFWWWLLCVHLVGEVRDGPASHSLGCIRLCEGCVGFLVAVALFPFGRGSVWRFDQSQVGVHQDV